MKFHLTYLKPKVALHIELPNVSLLLLIYQIKYCNELLVFALTLFTKINLGKLIFFQVICAFIKSTKSAIPNKIRSKPRIRSMKQTRHKMQLVKTPIVPWVGLQCVILAIPYHAYLLSECSQYHGFLKQKSAET